MTSTSHNFSETELKFRVVVAEGDPQQKTFVQDMLTSL